MILTKKWIGIGVAALGAAVILAHADESNVVLRAFTYGVDVAQRPGSTEPTIDYPPIPGSTLVNLARGRDVSATNVPNEVLALSFPCDLSAVSLVVYDQNLSNVVASVAICTNLVIADGFSTNGITIPPNGRTNEAARFVALMQVQPVGSDTNALLGGYITIAGRLRRDPISGCPLPVTLSLDKDAFDKTFALKEIPKNKDKDTSKSKLNERAGLANMMGAIQFVQEGNTNNLLIPLANISIRYDMPVVAP